MKDNDNMELSEFDSFDKVVVMKGHLAGLMSDMMEIGILQEKINTLISEAVRPGFWSKWRYQDARRAATKLAKIIRRLEIGIEQVCDVKTLDNNKSNIAGLNKVA